MRSWHRGLRYAIFGVILLAGVVLQDYLYQLLIYPLVLQTTPKGQRSLNLMNLVLLLAFLGAVITYLTHRRKSRPSKPSVPPRQ